MLTQVTKTSKNYNVAEDRDTHAIRVAAIAKRLHKFAVRVKERKLIAVVNNELSKRGTRDGCAVPAKDAGADVAHKRAVHTKYADAFVASVRDSNVAVAVTAPMSAIYEAQSGRPVQLPVITTICSETAKQVSVTTTEHADSIRKSFRGVNTFVICTDAVRASEVLYADERMKAKLRRQDLQTVVSAFCHEHKVVRRNVHLPRNVKLQWTVATLAAKCAKQRAVCGAHHIHGMINGCDQQHAAVARDRDAIAEDYEFACGGKGASHDAA